MTTSKSDCGCGDTANPLGDVTRNVASPTPATSASNVVLDGFRGLNPVDGLFLRAEHLKKIQDYARSLTTAAATANGPGIVHGLGVQLTEEALEISPGLAVSPRGRLLLLSTTAQIPLDGRHVPPRLQDGFWRVELHWATGTSGSAPVYGSLCNDACADGGATIQPWRDEGVEIRIERDSLCGLDAVLFARRRNWLASAYFERERAGGQPWLVPVGAGRPVSRWPHDWEDSTRLPQEAGVPLALLQSVEKAYGVESAYELDLWAARRLVDGPSTNRAWRERLAMRPWSVFLAQILQFEAENKGLTPEGRQKAAASVSQQTVKDLLDEFQLFDETVKDADPVRSRHSFQRLTKVVQEAQENPPGSTSPPPLATQSRFGELPPAGYLNIHDTSETLEDELRRDFFGTSVGLRLRRMRADQVAEEVVAAQHRDRIPLDRHGESPPQVDILVPADSAESNAAAYGWVAFVRRGPAAPPEPATEDVEVYLLPGSEDPEYFAARFNKEAVAEATETETWVGTLTFPKDGWAYPGGDVAEKVLDQLGDWEESSVALVVLTNGDRPLAAVRAGLFGTSLDSGQSLPVHAYSGMGVEAIIVIGASAH